MRGRLGVRRPDHRRLRIAASCAIILGFSLIVEGGALWELHREVWMGQNKAFGFEVQCVRYGGLIMRLEEIALRVQEYLDGEIGQMLRDRIAHAGDVPIADGDPHQGRGEALGDGGDVVSRTA